MKDRPRKHFSVYFRLYVDVTNVLHGIERARGDSFGIAVHKDKHAIQWQSFQKRYWILRNYLMTNTTKL